MVNLSNILVTLLLNVVHREAITVIVCLYPPRISCGKPTFAMFRITTNESQSLLKLKEEILGPLMYMEIFMVLE